MIPPTNAIVKPTWLTVVWKGGFGIKKWYMKEPSTPSADTGTECRKKDKNIERFRSPSIKPLKKGESK